jgi:uncharacterized protein YjiS (DUF1127 family)
MHRASDASNKPDRSLQVNAIFYALWEWLWRSNERYEVVLLNERQLRDVGLDQDFVRSQTAGRPLWHE